MSTKVASAMRYRISNQMRCGKQEKACKFIIFSITQRAGHEYIDGTCKDSIYSFFFFLFFFFYHERKAGYGRNRAQYRYEAFNPYQI